MPEVTGLPLYGTEFLLGAYGVLDLPRRFLLEMFFPFVQTFETEKVAFDKVDRARRKAAFVSPMIEGKVMRDRGFQTTDFSPPYVKPKHVVDMSRPLKRRPGERLLGQMSPLDRYNRAISDNLELEDDAISRAEEWMAAQILLNGAVTVSGPDHPTMTIDYLRPAAHTVALTGGLSWSDANIAAGTAQPLKALRAWNTTVMVNSGYNATMVVFDPLAADQFLKDPAIRQILDNRVNTPVNGEFMIGDLKIGGVNAGAIGQEVKYLGRVGEFECFVYAQSWVDDDGTVKPYLPANTVLLASPEGFQGTRCYGAIRDKKAGLKALERFPKMWDEEDPSVTYTMTQAAPLPVAGWAEASFAATVQ